MTQNLTAQGFKKIQSFHQEEFRTSILWHGCKRVVSNLGHIIKRIVSLAREVSLLPEKNQSSVSVLEGY